MIADTIPARVARGVAVLDEKRPGWHDRIDVDLLDMRCSELCVFGQEFYGHEDVDLRYYSAYDAGVDTVLDGDDDLAIACGFENDAELKTGVRDEYDELLAEWRRVIAARRSAA